jgi:signal transduction histidine kinase
MKKPGQKHLTSVVLLLAVIAIGHFYWYLSPSFQEETAPTELNLAGDWDVCLSSGPVAEDCEWRKVRVPADIPGSLRSGFKGWMIYRKRFNAPSSCMGSGAGCILFFGEIGDAAEARLNGVSIGHTGAFPPHARYAKHYPVHLDLSHDLLKAGVDANELVMTVYSMKTVQAGIRRGPVGIFSSTQGFKTAQSFVAVTVFVPILGFAGLFLIALLTSFVAFVEGSEDERLHSYARYCFASSIFLLSFSEVPREYLPIWISGYLHFALRALSDWAYFEMIRQFYGFSEWTKKVFRPLYLAAILAFLLAFAAQLLFGDIRNAGAGFDTSYAILRVAVPLLVLPHVLGIVGSFRERKTAAGKFFVFFFSVMLILQVHDSLIFHGYLSGNYAVKIYPFFIGICFGLVVLQRKQREREALLVAQENAIHAAQVAHDIRSPLAALNVVLNDIHHLPGDHGAILLGAAGRIQDIANSLVEKNRRRSANTDEPISVQSIPSLVDALVNEKKVQFRLRSGIVIETRALRGLDLFARVQPGELKRVLSNLLDNAVEAVDELGAVCVEVFSDGAVVKIQIIDNGRGIPAVVLSRLGHRGATFGKTGGSGLGLYHARVRAESWGGGLLVESAEGKGTTVTLLIPRSESSEWIEPGMRVGLSEAVELPVSGSIQGY